MSSARDILLKELEQRKVRRFQEQKRIDPALSPLNITLAGGSRVTIPFGDSDFSTAKPTLYLNGVAGGVQNPGIFRGCDVKTLYVAIPIAGGTVTFHIPTEFRVVNPSALAAIVQGELSNTQSSDWKKVTAIYTMPSGQQLGEREYQESITAAQRAKIDPTYAVGRAVQEQRVTLDKGPMATDYTTVFKPWPETGRPPLDVSLARQVAGQDTAIGLAQTAVNNAFNVAFGNWSLAFGYNEWRLKLEVDGGVAHIAAASRAAWEWLENIHRTLAGSMMKAIIAASNDWYDGMTRLAQGIAATLMAGEGQDMVPKGYGAVQSGVEEQWQVRIGTQSLWVNKAMLDVLRTQMAGIPGPEALPKREVPIEAIGYPGYVDAVPPNVITFLTRHAKVLETMESNMAGHTLVPLPDAFEMSGKSDSEAFRQSSLWKERLSCFDLQETVTRANYVLSSPVLGPYAKHFPWIETLCKRVIAKAEEIIRNSACVPYVAVPGTFAYEVHQMLQSEASSMMA